MLLLLLAEDIRAVVALYLMFLLQALLLLSLYLCRTCVSAQITTLSIDNKYMYCDIDDIKQTAFYVCVCNLI